MIKSRYNFIERLLNKYGSNKASKAMQKILDGFFMDTFEKSEWDIHALGDKKITKEKLKDSIHKKIQKSRYNYGWIKYTAVAAVVLVLLKLSLPSYINSLKSKEFATNSVVDSLLLPDNSIVILSPYSKITYSSDYNNKTRSISLLQGNAFFKVSKNKQKPFIVKSNEVKTTVLGTSFNVDLGPKKITVKVKTGRVKVATNTNQEIIMSNQYVAYNYELKTLKKERFTEGINWYAKDVILNQISLKNIAEFIKKRFGYIVVFNENIQSNQLVTINVSGKDTIKDILERLNYITKLNFKIKANEIIVTTPQ